VNEAELREAVRRSYEGRCGYCTVREMEAATELELDHFQPRSAGGTDDPDNLVYCCTACNRHKGDFWPETDPATATRRLLHPRRDDPTLHLREDPDGLIVALTETGAFHIDRLCLNRPPLVALRLARREVAHLRQNLVAARIEQTRLHERISALERDMHQVFARIAWLNEPRGE
jgi:HNH endonuclease